MASKKKPTPKNKANPFKKSVTTIKKGTQQDKSDMPQKKKKK